MNLQSVKQFFDGLKGGAKEQTSPVKSAQMTRLDVYLIFAVLVLLFFGLVMVYSASIALPDSPKYANYRNEHFFIRQLVFIGVGLFAGYTVFRIRIDWWQKYARLLFWLAIFLLILVLIPGIGKGVNGARRWLSFWVFNLQPSELMKLFIVMYAADYTVRKQEFMHKLRKGFLPMAGLLIMIGLLLMLEPDMGAFGVIVCIAMGILFLGGLNGIWFGGITAMLVGVFSLVIILSPWRRERIFAYLNPWDSVNALGKGYQLSHSLIAFGRGEIFGVGLGGSVEKLHYLPEAHTDFLMAVVGEELGFVGVLAVVAIFYWIVKRAFEIGRQAVAMDRIFAGLLAQGIGIWFGVQTFINMGVNLGLLPTKGLTLPLMSFGGSGIVMNCVALAILLRVDYENRKIMRGGSV